MADQWGGPRALEDAIDAYLETQEQEEQPQRKPRPDKLARRRITKEQAEAMAQGLEEHDSKIQGGRLVGG
jgi:hypothetical protein